MRKLNLFLTVCMICTLSLSGCGREKAAADNMSGQTGASMDNVGGKTEAEEAEEARGQETVLADGELQSAEILGLLPEGVDLEADCSEKQFYELMRRVIALKGSSPDESWESMAGKAADPPILRAYAARALYFTVWQTDYEVDAVLAGERGYFEFGATEANAWLRVDGDRCLMVDGLADYADFCDKLFEMDGGWKYEEGNRETIPTDWTISFVIQQEDPNSGNKVMEVDEEEKFHPFDTVSVGEAVKSAYRLYRSLEQRTQEPVYVRVDETGESTLSPELWKENPHGLPEVSAQKLPAWRGVGYTNKFNSRDCKEFSESDIRFLGENGFNFTRVMFGFSTLAGPDYPEDPYLVNEKELEKLDELIGWGMKYGVHIQICMHGQPGRHQMENFTDTDTGEYIVAENYQSGDLYPSDEEWKWIGAYWNMLARRYKDVPNRFLSFDLMNEWSVTKEEVDRFASDWQKVIAEIRSQDEDRALAASFDMGACIEAVESMAKQQVAVSHHLYSPGRICHLGASYMEKQFPYLKSPEWPMVYFPCTLSAGDKLTILNNVKADSIRIYFSAAEGNASVGVSADATELKDLHPEDGMQYENYWEIPLPEGAERIELSGKEGLVRIGMLSMSGGAAEVTLTPHDVFSTGPDTAGGLTLSADADGSFSGMDGRYYTAQDIYEEFLAPYLEVADKYQVGFMVNEFGIFGGRLLEGDTATNYYRDMREMFETNEIGFALCELNGGTYLKSDREDFSDFRGNTRPECWTYEYPGEVYRADTFYVDTELLKTLTQ